MQKYEEKKFSLPNLKGLSDKQTSEHLKLYSGYVKNTNGLLEKIEAAQKLSAPDSYQVAELRRRLGFEFNGMRLHEYYFESLGGDGMANINSNLYTAIQTQYGSFDLWLNEFKAAGVMRGIGWVILYYDQSSKMFHNTWITDHEVGHLAGLPIILAMDVWEHAYLLDYLPSQRKDYIEAFFNNLNWQTIETRLSQ
ncbi:MAG: superoxide dismutase [Candidatus Vogelbacteria bacterium]|nr:superoxide dismutase [Candidatus Vogelbacteria bacterium]